MTNKPASLNSSHDEEKRPNYEKHEKTSSVYDGSEDKQAVVDDEKLFDNDNRHIHEEDLDIQNIDKIVGTTDDPTLRVVSFRGVLIAFLLAALSSSVSQLMFFKPVPVPLSDTFLLMVAYGFCNLWSFIMPKGGWLNPFPFNSKEFTCIYICVSSANVSSYATYILSAQALYYTNSPSPAGGIFLLLATQLVGYGIAGHLRRFLVYPANMTWPATLPTVSLIKTLSDGKEDNRWRTRFFFMVFMGAFCYAILPSYMFTTLSAISVFCLAKQDSVWFTRLFGGGGVNEGLGILSISLDWSQLQYYTPLVLPLWVQLNIYFGILLLWIIAPILYINNTWHAQSFRFLSNGLFRLNRTDSTAVRYNQSLILNPDNSINPEKLAAYGNPVYSTLFAFTYIFINMGVTASVTHVGLFYGKQIWSTVRNVTSRLNRNNDVHNQLMSAYPEVPDWWYYIIFVIGTAVNIGLAYANSSSLPAWGVILAVFLSAFLSLPLNMIEAITGTGFGLNVVAQMICGFILPGYPVANMYFKTLGYNTLNQAGKMARDLKVGHYMKIPPRLTFISQIVGTVIGAVFNYIVNENVVRTKRDILLDPNDGDNIWNGASPRTINSAAITWGGIGPMAMFGPGSEYSIILWAFVMGFFLPIPGYLLHRKWPSRGFDKINIPMIMIGLCTLPGATSSWITLSFIIIVVTQGFIKRRYNDVFVKYNYLASAALDSGTSLMVFFLAMALQGGGSGTVIPFPSWAGNRPEGYVDYCCAKCDEDVII